MTEEPFVTIEVVAKHFAVSISTVRAWIRQGLIPVLKVSNVWRFKITEVEEALRKISGSTDEKITVPDVSIFELDLDPEKDC